MSLLQVVSMRGRRTDVVSKQMLWRNNAMEHLRERVPKKIGNKCKGFGVLPLGLKMLGCRCLSPK